MVFSVLYNVLYERDQTPTVNPAELVELVDFSTKAAQEEFTIFLHAEDQAFAGISTDVSLADKTLSMIDEIVEKFNLRYAHATEEISRMIDALSSDEGLRSNVQNSSVSAYEAAVAEKLDNKILDGAFEGTISGDTERAEFYTELSEKKAIKGQICRAIIRKIKDLLLAG